MESRKKSFNFEDLVLPCRLFLSLQQFNSIRISSPKNCTLSNYSGRSIIRTLSRTKIIIWLYNDLRMLVVAVDKKILVHMAAKSVVLSTEDHQVVG